MTGSNVKLPVDLRSDTVTRPTPAMREAMAGAEVDDDVIDVDPTVDRLQQLTAELTGKQAAIFMPSGTMTNQVAVRIHCKPGDEFICEEGCHIYNYEQGGFAQLSGVVSRPVIGAGNLLKLEQLTRLIRPDNEHLVRTRLVCLEITHNRGAGRIHPLSDVEEICAWAHQHGLRTHLDGARLFNAVAASNATAAEWCSHFDTVSVCFSKGLGAPVGSALAGSVEHIAEARNHRKLFGGGMRQAGIIAAGALHALQHHRGLLVQDHQNAQLIAAAVTQANGLTLDPEIVDTNIVIFRVDEKLGSAEDFVQAAGQNGVRLLTFSHEHVRAVTHLDITPQQAQVAAGIIVDTAAALAARGGSV